MNAGAFSSSACSDNDHSKRITLISRIQHLLLSTNAGTTDRLISIEALEAIEQMILDDIDPLVQ